MQSNFENRMSGNLSAKEKRVVFCRQKEKPGKAGVC